MKPFDGSKQSADLPSFLFENEHLLIIILSGYLLITVVIFVLLQITRPGGEYVARLKEIFSRFLSIGSDPFYSSPSKLALVFLFFNIFMFFNLNFLNGSTKTNLITIDTSGVIDSPSKLMRVKKTLAIFFDDEKSLISAHKHSLEGRLAKKRRVVIEPFVTKEKLNEMFVQKLDSYFFLASEAELLFTISSAAAYSKSKGSRDFVAFINPHIHVKSFLLVFYFRRNLEADKKQFISHR